jgi:hypothetical protein
MRFDAHFLNTAFLLSTPVFGVSVQCAADGESGVIRFLTAADGSGTLQAQTAFNNGECLANPSQYGAASVRFFCNSRSASQDIRQGLTHARLNWYQQSDCEYFLQRMYRPEQ